LIAYVAAAQEGDKFAVEPVTDSLKNEREQLPHSSTSHADCSLWTIIHRSSHGRMMLVPKTFRIAVQNLYC